MKPYFPFLELTQTGDEAFKVYILVGIISEIMQGDGETIVRTIYGGQYVVTEAACDVAASVLNIASASSSQ